MKITKLSTAVLSVCIVALVAACGPSPEQVAREEAMKKLEQASKDMEAAGKRLAQLKAGRTSARRSVT